MIKNIFVIVFCLTSFCFSIQAKEARDTDFEVAATLALLRMDLKNIFPGKSEVWWIGHRKCMADTARILFTRDQLSNMGIKMRIHGKEEVLKDPTWPRFINLIEYCQKKATLEVGR